MATEVEVRQVLASIVGPELVEGIADDEPVFERGVVDSLHLVELVSGLGSRDGQLCERQDPTVTMLGRALEVLDTEMLEWDAGGGVPEPQVRPGTEVIRVEPNVTESWREIVPRSRHKAFARNLARPDTGY